MVDAANDCSVTDREFDEEVVRKGWCESETICVCRSKSCSRMKSRSRRRGRCGSGGGSGDSGWNGGRERFKSVTR